ncbi:MAG: hypothetical protein EPN30_05655 [Actinomycetota bacterium]|nr:MAG: hypothetical protein EPN30_05655 [Actinomycetota bacterium]
MELHRIALTELAELLSTRQISARECVAYFIERTERINPALNSFVALDPDSAISKAGIIDDKRALNHNVGSLAGIPFGVKDLEDAEGFVTTRGSVLFANSGKAVQNSHMVRCFVAEGAIPIGKTNTPEFGWKSDTDNPVFGPTRNPYDLTRSPGGSSGGSAAAVASGQVPFATGSDGGGSLRIPASACGISAMKTSLGRIPSVSPVPTGWSDLSVSGPLAKTIRDTALLLDLVVFPDGRDFRSQSRKPEQWHQEISVKRPPAKAAFSPDLGYAPIDPEVSQVVGQAVAKLEEAGVEITFLDSLFAKDPLEEFFTMTHSYYAKMLEPAMSDPRYQMVDPGVRDQVEKGLKNSATKFLRASDLSFYMNQTLYNLFQEVDVLLAPTTAGLPPLVGGKQMIGGREVEDWVKLTYPFNMTRSPAASICAGISLSGLPVGLQIVGPHLGDLQVLSAAQSFEQILGTFRPEMT